MVNANVNAKRNNKAANAVADDKKRSHEDALRIFLRSYEHTHSKDLNLRDLLRAAKASKGARNASPTAIRSSAYAVALSAARIVRWPRINDVIKTTDQMLRRAPFRYKAPTEELHMADLIYYQIFQRATPAQYAYIDRVMRAIGEGPQVHLGESAGPAVQRYVAKLPKEVHGYIKRRLGNIVASVVKKTAMYDMTAGTLANVLFCYHAWRMYHANKSGMSDAIWKWGMGCTLELLKVRRALLMELNGNKAKMIYPPSSDHKSFMPIVMFLTKYKILPRGPNPNLSDSMVELIERMRLDQVARVDGALTAQQMQEVDAILAEPLPRLPIEACERPRSI